MSQEAGLSAPDRRMGRMARWRQLSATPLYRSSFALILSSMANATLGLLFWVLAARLYPVRTVGLGAGGISALQLVSIVGWVGLQYTLMRYAPIAGRTKARLICGTYLIGGLAAVAAAVVFSLTLAVRLGASLVTESTLSVVLFCASAAVWVVFSLQDAALVGIRRAGFVPIDNAGFGAMKLLLIVGFAFVDRPWTLLGSWVTACAVMVVVINVLLFRRFLNDDAPAALPPLKTVSRFSLGHTLVGVTGWFPDFLVPLLVIRYQGEAANAYYYAAWTIGFAARVLLGNMASALTTEAAYQEGQFAALARAAMRLCALVMTPAVLVMVAGAGPALAIFGHDYSVEGTSLLRLFALSIVPYAVVTFVVARDRNKQQFATALVVTSVGSLASIAFDVILIPRQGISGAGMGWLLGQTIAAVLAVLVFVGRSRREVTIRRAGQVASGLEAAGLASADDASGIGSLAR
jgi:O-antigen/teichoic acid export membrane protein